MQKARIDIYQEMAVSKENCWVLCIPQDIKPKSQLGVTSPLLECTNKKDFFNVGRCGENGILTHYLWEQ